MVFVLRRVTLHRSKRGLTPDLLAKQARRLKYQQTGKESGEEDIREIQEKGRCTATMLPRVERSWQKCVQPATSWRGTEVLAALLVWKGTEAYRVGEGLKMVRVLELRSSVRGLCSFRDNIRGAFV